MCSNSPRVNRIQVENFGPDLPAKWGKIQSFGKDHPAQFVAIGPHSEVDSCVVMDAPSVGDMVISKDSPLIMPIDGELTVRPWRSFGNSNSEIPAGKLELLVYDMVPPQWSNKRAPRLYPEMVSAALSSAAESSIFLNTTRLPGVNAAVIGKQFNLCVMGAKTLTMYLSNQASIDISWRLIHSRDGSELFPISPSGYADATPTYNTLAAGHNEAYHLDLSVDSVEHLYLLAKTTAAGTANLRVASEVHD